jgi:3-isopropylmalate/(R)-2-methylmalate dehydratase large subunit
MGMTMTQKILAAHAGLDKVAAGQLINAKLDIVLGNDITTPVAVNEFKKAGFDKVFDKDKVVMQNNQRPAVNLPAHIVSAIFMM